MSGLTPMIDKETIQSLLNDLESERVERTESTNNTDKFGEAICSFANDLADFQNPGYLIIGADDKGNVVPVKITDSLLKNIAAIRTEGNIQPQPSMTVEKVELDGGPVVVVEVQPSRFPPVRYKGKVCVRIGPRRGIANEDDERKLYEKRASHVLTFDALPCLDSSLEDLDLSLFRRNYLPKAFPEEVVATDRRDIRYQLQALGFYDMKFDCPTFAGLLMFGKNVERHLSGAYVQYVCFDGKSRGADIASDYKFSGNLMTILNQLDTFVSTTIAKKRPVPVSALREENIVDYPAWAVRELLMNAICHRDYESNGPIQFYQYSDRIEVLNPGALYGRANAGNFPKVNDYRNSVIAEAMRVLGFVNRFSRGIERVQEELVANNNGEADFDLSLGTAFLVKVNISSDSYGPLNGTKDGTKEKYVENEKVESGTKDWTKELSKSALLVLQAIKRNPGSKREEISEAAGISVSSTKRAMAELQVKGVISRIGGKKNGHWEITGR